jgi:hypothetical protein
MRVRPLPRASRPARSAPRALATASVAAAALAALGALAATSVPFQTSVNAGLVNALDSIGRNVLGDAVFRAYPPSPATPQDPWRIDIAADTLIPTAVGVFWPGDPVNPGVCHRVVQITAARNLIEGVPQVTVVYDPNQVTPVPQYPSDPCTPFGDRSGNNAFSTKLNAGLINAMSEVGKNLLGNAVFSAAPQDPWRIDIAADTAIPTAISVVQPADPNLGCTRIAQVGVVRNLDSGLTQVSLSYDPNRLTPVAGAIPATPIDVARCTAVN